jgi:AcrR family transcriptional regulator
MSPRPDVSLERQEQILDAAEKVFSERGLSGARMDDIVNESGLSKGALYWYYKSKHAVILALMERVLERELKQATKLVDSSGTSGERLQILMRITLSDIAGLGRLLPLAYEFLAMASRRKAVRQAMAEYYQRYAALLSAIIQQGIDSGEFAELDVEQAALSTIAMLEGLALVWFVAPEVTDIKSLGDAPMEALLAGFRARSS